MDQQSKRVLLIGWDAADWSIIHPLIDAGKMPALERVINHGVMGNLHTLHPVLSPMLWTSIATGKRPYKHGILGFTEPNDDGSGVRPVSSLSRKTKALWNILNQEEKKSIVVGWWPSHPVEHIDGVMVSNHYHRAIGPLEQGWPIAPGAVFPERLREELADLRFHPNELEPEDILPFVPHASEIDQKKDARLAMCAKTLAECTTVHAAAVWLMQNEPWDFMAVYYDAIDHFGHGFMKYHPPRRDQISEEDFRLYSGVVEAGYRYHDMMLGRLLQLAGEETTVVLVSDHGFHADDLRPDALPMEPAGPAAEHRDQGIFAMVGPGIKRDEIIHGATLLDITPTVLASYGLPIGEDMDGRPLAECFERVPDFKTVSSWDEIDGNSGEHDWSLQIDPLESQEALNQLVALGYVDPPGKDIAKQVATTANELKFNLARSYMDANLHAKAVPLLNALISDNPREYRFGIQLAICHRALDQIPEMRSVVDGLTEERKGDSLEAQSALQEMKRTVQERKEEGREPPLLSPEEGKEFRTLSSRARLNHYAIDYLTGFVLLAEGEPGDALRFLRKAEQADQRQPGLHLQIGETYLRMKEWAEAERAFRTAIEIEAENSHGHLGLARVFLARKKNRLAAESALDAIGFSYQLPMAHFCLGAALHRMGKLEPAVQALKVAVSINPNFQEAHLRLAYIYENRLDDPDQASTHRLFAAQLGSQDGDGTAGRPAATDRKRIALGASAARKGEHENFITIVSGVPRSGTSLMMKLLQVAGIEPLTDEVRKADEDNAKGYFELEAVKSTKKDSSWLDGAVGKAVKVIHLLVSDLPKNHRYRVIVMNRNFDEVIDSQKRMIEREGRAGANLDHAALKETFMRQLARSVEYLSRRDCFEVIEIDYNQLLSDPKEPLQRLREFLGITIPSEELESAIDASLYRSKSGQAS